MDETTAADPAEDEIEAAVRARRAVPAAAGFCHQCGAPRLADDRFCAKCGATLSPLTETA